MKEPILTPAQQQEADKLKKQQEAVKQITAILNENDLAIEVVQLIKVIPKK